MDDAEYLTDYIFCSNKKIKIVKIFVGVVLFLIITYIANGCYYLLSQFLILSLEEILENLEF